MKKRIIALSIAAMLVFAGCGEAPTSDNKAVSEAADEGENLVSAYATFELSSENINGGVWDDVISYTDQGENKSPQLSWDPVEGAQVYGIYMIDTDMKYFIHWKSYDVTETSLPLGWADKVEYVGPYPPSGGTHTYDVYVIAMKNPVERMKGSINSNSPKAPDFINDLDTDADGNTGNIIACGRLSGKFSN